MQLFGYEISKKIEPSKLSGKNVKDSPESFAPPSNPDGGITITSSGNQAGYYAQSLDLDNIGTNDAELIKRYRTTAAQPECDVAIQDIVNAAIVSDNNDSAVSLNLDNVDQPDKVKDLIRDEFNTLLTRLNFNFVGADIFRRWYIDGKIYFHAIVDKKKISSGIIECRMIDPTKITKVKEVERRVNNETGVETTHITKEYFLYSDDSFSGSNAVQIDPNTIAYVPSGLTDATTENSISYLHKSVKLVNQLRLMEDSLVIYRISRAPERRIFYIDTGNLPKTKAEEYVQGIMSKYRNKMVYDAESGEISDDRKSMSMLEDFWLPRREGGRGTEISTLPGGDNLSAIEDVLFFQKKLYRSLNVPASRLDSESTYNIGQSSEISREEVKFQKFVSRLRQKFSILFIELLRIQCLTRGIFANSEWGDIREKITIDYTEDNYFSELKNFEVIKERISVLNELQDYVGKYFSDKYIRTEILGQTEDDIVRIDKEIEETPKETEEADH
jgi:hypothetical protein